MAGRILVSFKIQSFLLNMFKREGDIVQKKKSSGLTKKHSVLRT